MSSFFTCRKGEGLVVRASSVLLRECCRFQRDNKYKFAPVTASARPSLYVSGLPFDFSDAQLLELFTPFGEVISAQMLSNSQRGKAVPVSPSKEVSISHSGVTLRHRQRTPCLRQTDNVGYGIVKMGTTHAGLWAIKAKNKKFCNTCKSSIYVKLAAVQQP